MLGLGPVYATLGNHDSYPSDLAAPLSLDGDLGGQFSWCVSRMPCDNKDRGSQIGCMIMSLPFGNTKVGCQLPRSNTRGRITQRI